MTYKSLYIVNLLNITIFNMFMYLCVYIVGVVDSEDIPLNLSRELLQESALIR